MLTNPEAWLEPQHDRADGGVPMRSIAILLAFKNNVDDAGLVAQFSSARRYSLQSIYYHLSLSHDALCYGHFR